jgi:DNA-binding HxlR family transcriptional regulator
MSRVPLADIIALSRGRWLAPLLARLHETQGGRFVELVNALGIGRDSLARTLDQALAAGWVMRNPGHGHPLRPEYVLTPEGERLAGHAWRVNHAVRDVRLGPDQLSRWSLPIVHAMSDGADRFNLLAKVLTPASLRALSLGLRNLAANDLIDRRLEDGYPPLSRYALSGRGLILAGAAGF